MYNLPESEYSLRISASLTILPIVKFIWEIKSMWKHLSNLLCYFELTRETSSVHEANFNSHLCVSNG